MALSVGTFDDLAVGESFATPSRTIGEEEARALIALGGYTHPMFTDPAFAAGTAFGRSPVPGPAMLLAMGGLVEQTGRFDETTIALVGFDAVRFVTPAFPGDELRVEVRVLDKERRSEGRRGLVTMEWRCLNARGETVVEATARMLFRTG